MTVHRKRPKAVSRRRPKRGDPAVSRVTSLGATRGSGDLGAAANIVADAAAGLAGWSEQIPSSIRVEVHGNTAEISSQVGPAYPNEIEGVRHPTFGHDPWVTNQHRPFLAPALEANMDAAMRRYAQKIDKMARRAGW